jgi:ribosome-associated protein
MENISITTEFIRLDAFLKFAALAASGGEAKQLIAEGLVSLNGTPCTQRGRKLYPGDVVAFSGAEYRVLKA